MKRLLNPVYAGISGKLDLISNKYRFKVDFNSNTADDVIKFSEPYFQQSAIDGNVYWFGYSFNDGQSNPRRDEFIQFLKTVQPEKLVDPEDEWSGFDYNDETITETDLNTMITRSLSRLHLNKYSVDVVVYPESRSGNLVKMIVRCIRRFLASVHEVPASELSKADSDSIDFDYVQYARDLDADVIDVPDYVDDEYIANMMYKARSAKVFSLRKYIKPPVLRNYISNFYKISQNIDVIESASTILVVDDFGTTGSTIRELIRNIRKYNQNCEIYIFTLMGNRRTK